MSLSLLQGYSSAEEEVDGYRSQDDASDTSSSLDDGGSPRRGAKERSIFDHPEPARGSLLPSAFDAFSEVGFRVFLVIRVFTRADNVRMMHVSGPPEFLNNAAAEGEVRDSGGKEKGRGRGGKTRREKKDLPAGAVLEAKPQLVGIRDRVRSDIDGSGPPGLPGKTSSDGPRLFSAANPEPKDAADLLRMCVQCGIPKTFSHSKGMVCPVCGDRPPPDANSTPEKKRGPTIKDKEKNKRMKGQSSHATWKSETEMQMRQQYD